MIYMNLADFNLHASEQLNGYAIMKKSSSESKQNTLLAAGVLIQFAVQIAFSFINPVVGAVVQW